MTGPGLGPRVRRAACIGRRCVLLPGRGARDIDLVGRERQSLRDPADRRTANPFFDAESQAERPSSGRGVAWITPISSSSRCSFWRGSRARDDR